MDPVQGVPPEEEPDVSATRCGARATGYRAFLAPQNVITDSFPSAFAICAAMFQNSNSLPIALVQSLVVEVPGLKWDKEDNKDQMLGRALTYMVVYSTLGMVLRWSWGVKLLSSADDDAEHEDAEEGRVPDSIEITAGAQTPGQSGVMDVHIPRAASPEPVTPLAGTPLNGTPLNEHQRFNYSPARRLRSPSPAGSGSAVSTSHRLSSSPLVSRGRTSTRQSSANASRSGSLMSVVSNRRRLSRTDSAREFWGLPEQPKAGHSGIVHDLDDVTEDSSESELEDDEADEWGSIRADVGTTRSPFYAELKARAYAYWAAFCSFMTVPTWAALVSVIIALIPPLQAELNKFTPLKAAINSAGRCSIPVTLVVLGAFFYTPKPPQLPEDEEQNGKGFGKFIERKLRSLRSQEDLRYAGESKTVFVAVMSRMILVPLVFLPSIALMARYDWFRAAEDPVFILCAVLLVSSPPALTLAQITQAASGDAFERLISKTISWSYAVLTPPCTLIYVVVGLLFGRL